MTDPASPRWADPAGLPAPTIYDPSDDSEPPFATMPAPTVVLLLVGEVDRRWAARTAIELSDAWATAGRRVVLADFHLENPVLRAELGGEGLDGVVDLFVYGASAARCTRDVPGREFQFIPTGTYTPDAEEVFRHPRWSKFIAGFRQSRATLVVFASAGAADLGALGTWVDQTILLGEPADPALVSPLRQAGTEIRGLILPPRGDSATGAPAQVDRSATTPVANEEFSAPATPPSEPAEREDLHLPPPPARVPHAGHRIAVLTLWILLGAAALTAIGYVVATLRPDLMPWAAAGEAPESAPVVAGVSTAPQALGEQLPYSVRVAAYGTFEDAHDRLQGLREQVPGVLFFITPEDVQGITYHKVMAGALPDTAIARETMDVLVASEAIGGEDAAGGRELIEEMRYSLLLGEVDSRGAANAVVDSLLTRQIPAYRLAVPISDGELRWYVYAGAFPDSASSEGLRERLTAAGLQPRLTPRFGSPASPEL